MLKSLLLPIYKSLMPLRYRITSSPRVIKFFFDIDIPTDKFDDQIDFDQGTIIVRHAMKKEISSTAKVFEMGIGSAALLSVGDAKRRNSIAFGADIQEKRVEQSKLVALKNGVKEDFKISNLFQMVDDKYDFLIFNPPYVPSDIGKTLRLDNKLNQLVWDGGAEGTNIIKKFLIESTDYLLNDGKIILGINDLYINKDQILSLLGDTSLEIKKVYQLPLLTTRAYIIGLS